MLSAISRICARYGVLIQLVGTVIGLLGGSGAPIHFYFGGTHFHVRGRVVGVEMVGVEKDLVVDVATEEEPAAQVPSTPSLPTSDPSATPPTAWRPESLIPFDGPITVGRSIAYPVKSQKAWGHVFVLSDDFCWLFGQDGSNEEPQVELAGVPQDQNAVVSYLKEPSLQAQLRIVTDVIAVGLASCEGTDYTEGWRAERRADMLLHWLRLAKGGTLNHVHRVNLGRYQHCSPESTAESTRRQRPVLFMALIRRPDVHHLSHRDLLEAVQAAEGLDLDLQGFAGWSSF